MNFLNCINAIFAAEALARQLPADGPLAFAQVSLIKQLLPPLWTSFVFFARKWLQLRKIALKGCWAESLLFRKLRASNPLSPHLFHPDAMAEIVTKAENQGKSILQILEYKNPAVKRAASSSSQHHPKKAKGDHPKTPSQPKDVKTPQRRRFSKQQSSQNSPRKKGHGTPRSRYKKSPRAKGSQQGGNKSQDSQDKSQSF